MKCGDWTGCWERLPVTLIRNQWHLIEGGGMEARSSTTNTFACTICSQDELNVALFHIKDVSSRQREVQKTIEQLQSDNGKDLISVQHR